MAALNHRITLQTPSTTENAFGETGTTWADTLIVWAQVEPLRGREYFAAQQVNAEVTHKVTMRYTHGIVPTMRIKYGLRYFDITSIINPVSTNRMLTVMAVERNPS